MSRMLPLRCPKTIVPRSWTWAFSAAFVLAVGCDSPAPVTVYTVPTEVPEQLRAGKERMLAAMVPKGDQVWFFKVTGPEAAISLIEPTYRNFVESINIEDGNPDLEELPEGWRLGGKKPMRIASIDVETPNKQLDISISTLGRQTDWDNFVAINVNRWRGQLGLPASDAKWAGGQPLTAATSDGESVWVDLLGEPSGSRSMSSPPFAGAMSAGPMSAGPFAGQTPPMANALPGSSSAASSPPSGNQDFQSDPRLKFDRPEGWRDGRMSSMRMAAFNVGPEDSPAELTVILAGGDIRGNVDRWLGQVNGGGVSPAIVDKAMAEAKNVKVDGRPSQRFLLTGSDPQAGEAIDVTIVPMDDGISLFVKMSGPVATVTAQSEAIASFLESLKLNI